MSLLQNPLSNSRYRIKSNFPNNTHFSHSKIPNFSIIHNPSNPPHFQISNSHGYPFKKSFYLLRNRHFHSKAYDSSSITAIPEHETPTNLFKFDTFLTVLESLCVVSSLMISVGCIANWFFFRHQNSGLWSMGNRVLVWLLAGAVAVGSLIRRRQWRRVCGSPVKSKPGFENGNVIERIEKLEESLKSATTIIRVLSRQLEKLGTRFRVTRKALKDPIAETAALAQKNSEAARALAVQGDILEKELAEVQKVLLAMQDHQQKQLELILAIVKNGEMTEAKRKASQGPVVSKTALADKGLRRVDGQQIQPIAAQKGTANDKASGS